MEILVLRTAKESTPIAVAASFQVNSVARERSRGKRIFILPCPAHLYCIQKVPAITGVGLLESVKENRTILQVKIPV